MPGTRDPEPAYAPLFGRNEELLLWRSEEGLAGRLLTDDASTGPNDPARPEKEKRLLLTGHAREFKDGFTLIEGASGTRTAIPAKVVDSDLKKGTWPYLTIHNYFEEDKDTGMVRVSVSRLVDLVLKGTDNAATHQPG